MNIRMDIRVFRTLKFRPKPKNNLTVKQKEVMVDNIITKPADKSSQKVFMEKEQYLFEAHA